MLTVSVASAVCAVGPRRVSGSFYWLQLRRLQLSRCVRRYGSWLRSQSRQSRQWLQSGPRFWSGSGFACSIGDVHSFARARSSSRSSLTSATSRVTVSIASPEVTAQAACVAGHGCARGLGLSPHLRLRGCDSGSARCVGRPAAPASSVAPVVSAALAAVVGSAAPIISVCARSFESWLRSRVRGLGRRSCLRRRLRPRPRLRSVPETLVHGL